MPIGEIKTIEHIIFMNRDRDKDLKQSEALEDAVEEIT